MSSLTPVPGATGPAQPPPLRSVPGGPGATPADALFISGERFGWVYRDCSLLARGWTVPPPTFVSPPDPIAAVERQQMQKKGGGGASTGLIVAAVLWTFIGLFIATAIASASDAAGLVALIVWAAGLVIFIVATSKRSPKRRLKLARSAWAVEVEQRKQAHAAEFAHWKQAMDQHVANENRRISQLAEWGSVRTVQGTKRVDVYGGNEQSWESLLTTFGASALASGGRLTLIDLSEGAVGAELYQLTMRVGLPTRAVTLPEQLDQVDLMGPLDTGALVDVLLETLHGDESAPNRVERSMDDRILRGVVGALGDRVTVSRLVVGLSTLLESDPPPPGTPLVLSLSERAAIQSLFSTDVLAQMRERIVALEAQLYPLRQLDSMARAQNDDALACYAISELGTTLLNDMLVDLLPQLLLSNLRTRGRFSSDVLIVAGADRLRRRHLERLSDLAARRGVFLFLLFRHLREDVLQILGGDASAALFLRLGNADEAEQATRFIGKNEYFEVAQLTETVGSSQTHTSGTSEQYSEGEQYGIPMYMRSKTRTWGTTESLARGIDQHSAVARNRVRRLAVEPETLQQLPTTEFVLVELDRRLGGRRLAWGDCNPDIALMHRVSPHPFEFADVNQVFR